MTSSRRKRKAPDATDARELTAANSPLVLVLDVGGKRSDTLCQWLRDSGFRTLQSQDGSDAPSLARARRPDLVLLDGDQTSMNWMVVCRELRKSEHTNIPVLLLLDGSNADWDEVIEGLAIGETNSVNDFLVKPFSRELLLAKLKTTLKVGTLQHELQVSNSMMKELTLYLDNLVEAKVAELENVNRLRRYFSPQIVEAVISEDPDEILKEHRGEITVVFLDLRKFTPFAESHTPQEVIRLVRDFHETVGPVIFRYGGTLERFTGDGMMVFLGDPKPMPDHAYEAIRMALHIQYMVGAKREKWSETGYDFGLGIGIATGEATMGTIGFERRYDYAAIGTVTNLAARLCSQAAVGQTLIAEETHSYIKDRVYTTSCGEMHFKGFSKPSPVYAVEGLHSPLHID